MFLFLSEWLSQLKCLLSHPARESEQVKCLQVQISFFSLKPLQGGSGFCVCWFTCLGSPECEGLMQKSRTGVITSCDLGGKEAGSFVANEPYLSAQTVCMSYPRLDVWLNEGSELKHSGRKSCFCTCQIFSFSSFVDMFCETYDTETNHKTILVSVAENTMWGSVSRSFPDNEIFQ